MHSILYKLQEQCREVFHLVYKQTTLCKLFLSSAILKHTFHAKIFRLLPKAHSAG